MEWIDETGNPITGHAAATKLRQESEQWTGILDQSLLEKSLIHIKEIYSTTQPDLHQGGNNWTLRNKLQGIQHIADLLGSSYVDEYETYEEMVKELKPEDLSRFYENRLTSLSDFLNKEGNWGYANYTDEEKQYIIDQYGYMKDPDNPKHWIIDDEAAMVVRRIYSMYMDGYGTEQIATILDQEKVLIPRAYWIQKGVKKAGRAVTFPAMNGSIPL